MAPTILPSPSTLKHVRTLTNTLSLLARSTDLDLNLNAITPLASIFALIVRDPHSIHQRSLTPSLNTLLSPPSKRQQTTQGYILAIPTTYANLNSGPSPGAVVGIVLGSISGFILIFFIVLLVARAYGGRVVERETVIRTHRHSSRKSRSRSSHTHNMSEPPRRQSSRRETVVVEERIRRESRPPPSEEEVIVEEQEDDIVEVIEEHSPERRPSRRESKRTSGFRTVDPAEFGGGNAPRRKVSRRD